MRQFDNKNLEILTETIRKDFTEKFGEKKTQQIQKFFKDFFHGIQEMYRPFHIPLSGQFLDTKVFHPKDIERVNGRIIFYKENDGYKKVWMELKIDSGELLFRDSDYWHFFVQGLGIDKDSATYITKVVMEPHLGSVVKPRKVNNEWFNRVENWFNQDLPPSRWWDSILK